MVRGRGKRKSVPILAVLVVLKLVFDDTNHNIITNQPSSIHNLLCLDTERSLLGDLLSQHVTSRQMADTEFLLDLGSLSTFTCCTKTRKQNVPLASTDAYID